MRYSGLIGSTSPPLAPGMDKRVRINGLVSAKEDGNVRLVVDEASYEALAGTLLLNSIAIEDMSDDGQASANRSRRFSAACKVGDFIPKALRENRSEVDRAVLNEIAMRR